MSLIKVNKNKNPYHIIGEYIEKHITYIDDIIAVISLDGNIINELFLVEITTESNFIWQNDWWEGEENVELIDFFFVRDACKRCDNNDLISKQQAIDAVEFGITYAKKINKETGEVTVLFEESNAELEKVIDRIKQLPPAESQIIRCKNCKHYKYGMCMKICANKSTNGFCDWGERKEVTI